MPRVAREFSGRLKIQLGSQLVEVFDRRPDVPRRGGGGSASQRHKAGPVVVL